MMQTEPNSAIRMPPLLTVTTSPSTGAGLDEEMSACSVPKQWRGAAGTSNRMVHLAPK